MAIIIGSLEPAEHLQFAQFERELLDEGWQHGAPSPSRFVEMDRSMVESSRCERCFGALTFVPFMIGQTHPAYRAFAVCRRCNTGSEF